jgi:pilus assembly protein CpaE
MNRSDPVMPSFVNDTETLSMGALSVLIICPDEVRRRVLTKALSGPQSKVTRELARYPPVDDVGQLIETDCDVIVVDADADPERALDVVENVCSVSRSVTVMVYSSQANSELLVRCMRAGAREFLTEPLLPAAIGEALVRASARRDEVKRHRRVTGKLYVFVGAKGGAGTTTVATNFAVALARESGSKVCLLDLDLDLGDAALTLGLTTKFSALDALENAGRIDSEFFSALMVKHSSGLSVLGAPDAIPEHVPSKSGIQKLLRLAREEFAYTIVDAGPQSIETYEALFGAANTVYLVTQVSIADLRNSNRLVSRFFTQAEGTELQIVLNRFAGKSMEIDEAAITKALTRPANWKIPNDFPAMRRAQNTGIPIASENNSLARVFKEMALVVCGKNAGPEKKKKFGLFG